MCGAVVAHCGDGVVDLGLLGLVELGDVAVDVVDQPPDPGDLFLGGGGVGAGPLVEAVDLLPGASTHPGTPRRTHQHQPATKPGNRHST